MSNYLYNGWELPPLPEWDKSKYPYAAISVWYSSKLTAPWTIASLYLSDVPLYIKKGWLVFETQNAIPKSNGSIICYKWDSLGIETGSVEFTRCTEKDATLVADDMLGFGIDWANYDVLNYENDSVVVAVSTPVPVSAIPVPPPDPLSMLLGWRAGRAVRNSLMRTH